MTDQAPLTEQELDDIAFKLELPAKGPGSAPADSAVACLFARLGLDLVAEVRRLRQERRGAITACAVVARQHGAECQSGCGERIAQAIERVGRMTREEALAIVGAKAGPGSIEALAERLLELELQHDSANLAVAIHVRHGVVVETRFNSDRSYPPPKKGLTLVSQGRTMR